MSELTEKQIFNFIDLTSLNSTDSNKSITDLAEQTVKYHENGYTAAAICVFPNFSDIVKEKLLGTPIKTAVVGACFPSSQSFLDTKILECKNAVKNGAEEVDIVLNLGAFFDENYDAVLNEIKTIKENIEPAKLKVILETGELKENNLIKKAAEISIDGGADFIKTSTGKVSIGATPEAVGVMADVVKAHFSKTNKFVGIKVSGGVKTKEDAIRYYNIVQGKLGKEFMNNKFFRIGASSLAKHLMS